MQTSAHGVFVFAPLDVCGPFFDEVLIVLKISIGSNLRDIQRTLSDFERKQVPFAFATALNDTARDARKAVQVTMGKVFDRPVARTLNSVKIKTGTKAKPEAKIWIDDDPDKGIPAAKYLMAEILGGPRRPK